MKIICRGRGSGKTKELLEYAQENHGVVVSSNARALRVKAQAYGIDVEIVDVTEVDKETFTNRKIAFHNLDRIIEKYYSDAQVIAASMTEEE